MERTNPAERISQTTPESFSATRLLADQAGRFKPMLLLWALGIPLPIVLIIALIRGC